MSTFFDEVQSNNIYTQTLVVQDGIDCPEIRINGIPFTGELPGGSVTIPYLETNYVKKTAGNVLADLTSTGTQVISTKALNAPSISTGTITAQNVYTNMSSIQDSTVVNVGYTNKFAEKANVFTKAETEALNNLKLSSQDFNTFQQTNNQNLNNKQDVGVSYTKSQTDSLISNKVDASTLANYQGTVTTALAQKMNNGEAFTKAEVTNIVSGKLDKSYGVSNDAVVAGKATQFALDQFKTEVNTALAQKGDVGNVYSKTETNNLLTQKVDNDYFQTYSSANSNALNTKVSQTAFDTFQSSNTNALNSKVSNSAFNVFQSSNSALIDTKYSIADFNTFNSGLTTTLGNKVNVSDYNDYKTANTNAINLKLDTSIFNSNKTSTDNLIATKANIVDVYNKTQTDAKDSFIQNALDSYKTSNNTAVGNKLDTSVFTAFDGQVTTNFNNLQTQVNQRLKITDFDTYRTNTSSLINTKQDIIPYAFNQSLTTTDNPSFASVSVSGAISNPSQLTTKAYVDNVGSTSVLAGTGLSKGSDNTLSVNSAQPQITSVGTLSGLNLSAPLTLPSGDSLRFTRANGATGQMLIGGDTVSNEIFNFKHIGGNGEFLFSGSATSKFTVALPVTINNANDSTGTSNGSLKVLGGVGIAKSIYVGGTSNLNNLNVTGTTMFNTLRIDSPINTITSVSIGGAGNFTIDYPLIAGGRILVDGEGNFNLNRGILTVINTSDSASSTSGSVRLNGGIAVGKSAYIASNLTCLGTSTLNNLNITGSTVLGTTNVSSLNQDVFTRYVTTNINTPSQSFAKALVIQSTNVNNNFDTFEIRNSLNEAVFRSQMGNGATNFKSSIYIAEGQVAFGSTANGSTITQGVLATVGSFGTGNTASLDFHVNATGNERMFRWYKSGQPNNPLMSLSYEGNLTSNNYSSGTVQNSTTQTSVTFTKTTDNVNWSKTGKIAEVFYQFQISAQSGTQTAPLQFTLPVNSAITATMDSTFYLYRNGGQVTNMRLNFTSGSNVCSITVNNGFGNYIAFATNATENLVLMFQYPTV